ncbi:hypothetical protein Clacol_001596 [Clathrus columnatus]|uniref:Phosphotransferase n=1 Tax=Clathrus columnatus TaxID=1419009 RepID=A0AAV4ZYK6_9AGAM|nr:hypothetical protein Clacol_001596 [Clathrus columnatus]
MSHRQRELESIEQEFNLSKEKLQAITKTFVDDFNRGLSQYNEPMAMIPTFVTGPLPDGTEEGRVCEVHLHGDKTFTLRQQKYKVSDTLKTGEARDLFNYLADCVDAFLTNVSDQDLLGESDMKLGLTFSFPVEQTALNRGKILTWTKGFSAQNAVGHDVVQLLQEAFDRKHLHVECVALVNDVRMTTYTTPHYRFGTGTNGAYVERVSNIRKLANSPQDEEYMVVNTEWGAFDNERHVLPFTRFDSKLDRKSINPRLQAFEKFISGMYLGEITRNILLNLIDACPAVLFGGHSTRQLNTHYGFDTAIMSDIENAKTAKEIKEILFNNFGLEEGLISEEDTETVRWACKIVATRAAKLSATAVAAVLIQTDQVNNRGEDMIKIGVDGSLIQHYPGFEERLREALREIVGEEVEKRILIGLAKDGSGVGAALCALQATKSTTYY